MGNHFGKMFDPTEHTQTCDSRIPSLHQETCVRIVKAIVYIRVPNQKLHKWPLII